MTNKIVFENFRIPVPASSLNRMTFFKDGCLSVDGVRISILGTEAFFHILTWKDVHTLHRINIDLGDYIHILRQAKPDYMQKLFIRRAQYASKQLRCKKRMWALT